MNTERNDAPRVSIIVGVTGKRGYESVFNLLDSFRAREGKIDFNGAERRDIGKAETNRRTQG